MTTSIKDIRIDTYNYPLPDERIAKYPLARRDQSKLLLYKGGSVEESRFSRLSDYLPKDSLLVFNNTRVIRARLLFRKETGARIEIFCLEPVMPRDYALIFQQTGSCSWDCMIGNLKKWKEGTLSLMLEVNGKPLELKAERIESRGETHRVRFTWESDTVTFAELLETAGVLPIPPYLHRETEENDLNSYQTVYSKIKGSVAAPTAGLHFTPELLAELDEKGYGRTELTLHVGAGTFKPVKSETIEEHEMHTEFISVPRPVIEQLKANIGKVIAVGTTSVRTLESLYYVGVKLATCDPSTEPDLKIGQWFPYDAENNRLSAVEALQHILDYLERNRLPQLITSTQIMIVPGYDFKIVRGIVTNFHQPQSTLLLLVSAFVKGDWQQIYDYALSHDFRFLSYGDSSLLL